MPGVNRDETSRLVGCEPDIDEVNGPTTSELLTGEEYTIHQISNVIGSGIISYQYECQLDGARGSVQHATKESACDAYVRHYERQHA